MNWITSTLWEPRSRLYRRRLLQVNTRWKALDAIYKIRILLHRSGFKISIKKCWKLKNSLFIFEKSLTIFDWNFEVWAVQKYANLVDRVKSFPTSIYLQKSASIQPRTSLSKFEVIYSLLFIRLLTCYTYPHEKPSRAWETAKQKRPKPLLTWENKMPANIASSQAATPRRCRPDPPQ